ncbi:MAG: histidine kinaselike ATPase [Paenibacillus sp.]|jgi:signal transduction histidine kinase|nr:histidine kinaselike ATPase [Paenibacillus sp.]
MILSKEEHISEDGITKIKAIRDYVDVIDNEISHIIHTEQMLSGEELWTLECIDPSPVIEEIISFMSIKARVEDMRLVHQVKLNGETIQSNVVGFKLILSNLLSNAIKYSYEQSSIHFTAAVEGAGLVLRIRDEGIGMDERQVAMLFHKYGKMNQERSGQGIGLYMVKTLVDHFQGTIQVKSRPNEGTEIRIDLPLAAAQKHSRPQSPG